MLIDDYYCKYQVEPLLNIETMREDQKQVKLCWLITDMRDLS